MSAPTNRAVFLSYASQDAEAARRICDSLRSGGVEVWFDADGGLEHGDEWDAKIRRQIKECVLFIPVISANTQARHEGYFRIEWDLAAERARGIASGVPFILPVVIDDTREPDALVPDRFRMVQWTKLRGGEVTSEVQQRFLRLWSHRAGVLKHEAAQELSTAAAPRETVRQVRRPIYVGLAATVAVILAAAAWWHSRRAPPENIAERPSPPAKGLSEAEQLVTQARDLIYDPDSARNEFSLAENLLKRATELAPASGEAWGASALLNHYFFSRAYDHDQKRLARSLAEAEKALRLRPHNTDALLALGLHRQAMDENERAGDFLAQAHATDPQNYKVILAQAMQTANPVERAHFLLAAATQVAHPAELYYYAAIDFDYGGRWQEAQEAINRAIAAQPFWRVYVEAAVLEYNSSADPAKIGAWLDRVPEFKRDEPRVAFMRYLAALLRRDTTAAIQVLNALAVDYLEDNFFTGPKSYLLANAYELAGKPERALEQWQLAERVVREKLAANPNDPLMRPKLAVLLAATHRTDEARQTAAACAADERVKDNWAAREVLAEAHVRLGEPDRAIALLTGERTPAQSWGFVSAATLAAEPRWAALRDRPGYPQLLEQFRRSENGGAGVPSPAAAPPEDKTPPADKSVAVLAFANLSDDKGNEYFSDGISEELLTVLQKIPGLHVAARTSAFSFKGKNATAQEIGTTLNVAHLVEGSVQKIGNRVKISARLSRAATGEELWSKSFPPRELTDAFAAESEIALAIVAELRGRLAGNATAPAEIQAQVQAGEIGGTKNAEARQLYLQGKYFANQFTVGNLRRAEELLQRAVELEPSYAQAWAALARTAAVDAGYSETQREVEAANALAHRACDRALELAPELAATQLARFDVQVSDFDWRGAAESLRHATVLAPGDAAVVASAANLAYYFGQVERTITLSKQAVALDPVNPELRVTYATALASARDYDDSSAEFHRIVELSPTAPWGHAGVSTNFTYQGRYDEAAAEAALEVPEWVRLYALALAQWGQKKQAEAEASLALLIKNYADVSAYQIAEVYGFRRENERAFDWLERACRQHDPGLAWSKPDPLLESLHADPRWPVFLKKIGLADEQLK